MTPLEMLFTLLLVLAAFHFLLRVFEICSK